MLWPSEWSTHKATWIIWPCREEIWSNIERAYQVYAQVANTLIAYEPVFMIVPPKLIQIAKSYLHNDICIIEMQVDDSWARDTLPIFTIEDAKITSNNFIFNAWGNKFSPYQDDANLKDNLSKHMKWKAKTIDMVLEGGSVCSNGKGLMLTTAECIFNKNRNPSLSKKQILNKLKKYLHCTDIICLPWGIDSDVDTDGHVDNVACFVNDKTILLQSCYDEKDPNYKRYQDNKLYLAKHFSDIKIIEIEQPDYMSYQGARLPLSYLNFYIANNVVVMPVFKQVSKDKAAFDILKSVFLNREIKTINVLDLIKGGGGIHCITMQQPSI